MADTYKIRTSLQPDVDLEVDATEYRTLRALGVIEKAPAKADKEVSRVATGNPPAKDKE